jgi:hypothetical protein
MDMNVLAVFNVVVLVVSAAGFTVSNLVIRH